MCAYPINFTNCFFLEHAKMEFCVKGVEFVKFICMTSELQIMTIWSRLTESEKQCDLVDPVQLSLLTPP